MPRLHHFTKLLLPFALYCASGLLTAQRSGIGSYDFNNDGWKDLFIAEGNMQYETEKYSSRKSRQENALRLIQ